MAKNDDKRDYRSPAVTRAFNVLDLLALDRHGFTLSEIAQETGIPASSLLCILGSLRAARVVRLSQSRRYVLDVEVLRLGQAYTDGNELVDAFHPEGRRLARSFDETVHLGVLTGPEVVYVARHSSTQPLQAVAALGRRLPAYASAVGKSILAWHDEQHVRELYPDEELPQFTRTTRTSQEALLADLAEIRAHGYGQSDAECIDGLQCISAAIFDHTDKVVGAVGVSVPENRMTQPLRRSLIVSIVTAAASISQSMGARTLPTPYEVEGRAS